MGTPPPPPPRPGTSSPRSSPAFVKLESTKALGLIDNGIFYSPRSEQCSVHVTGPSLAGYKRISQVPCYILCVARIF